MTTIDQQVMDLQTQFFAANGDGSVRKLAYDIARLLEQDADACAKAGKVGDAVQQATQAYQWRNRGGAPITDADRNALQKRIDALRAIAEHAPL